MRLARESIRTESMVAEDRFFVKTIASRQQNAEITGDAYDR